MFRLLKKDVLALCELVCCHLEQPDRIQESALVWVSEGWTSSTLCIKASGFYWELPISLQQGRQIDPLITSCSL